MKMLLLLLSFNSVAAWAEDCSKVLSSRDHVVLSIRDLAKLRVNLDLARARGVQNTVTQQLEQGYQSKISELAVLEPNLDQLLKEEVARIQKNKSTLDDITSGRANVQQTKFKKKSKVVRVEKSGKLLNGVGSFEVESLSNGQYVLISSDSEIGASATFVDSSGQLEDRSVYFEKNLSNFAHSRLLDDAILISGGDLEGVLSSIRKIDSKTQTIEEVGHLQVARYSHSQVTLRDGRVLFVGGLTKVDGIPSGVFDVEVYDPTTHSVATFLKTDFSLQGKCELLLDGNVLVHDGTVAYLIDVAQQEVTLIGHFEHPRKDYSSGLLSDGRLMVSGGWSELKKKSLSTIEMVDTISKTIETLEGTLAVGHTGHQQITLDDKRVLIVGGKSRQYIYEQVVSAMTIFDPENETINAVEVKPLSFRVDHRLIRLSDGSILVVGGSPATTRAMGSVQDVERISIGK